MVSTQLERQYQLSELLTTEAVSASKSLYKSEEIPLAGLLQTEVQQQNAHVHQRIAKNGVEQAWRRLSTAVGGTAAQRSPINCKNETI